MVGAHQVVGKKNRNVMCFLLRAGGKGGSTSPLGRDRSSGAETPCGGWTGGLRKRVEV